MRFMVIAIRRSGYGVPFRAGKSGKRQRKGASPGSMVVADDSEKPLRDAKTSRLGHGSCAVCALAYAADGWQ
jgi:hypothetical protein